jgi:hypothetical protein
MSHHDSSLQGSIMSLEEASFGVYLYLSFCYQQPTCGTLALITVASLLASWKTVPPEHNNETVSQSSMHLLHPASSVQHSNLHSCAWANVPRQMAHISKGSVAVGAAAQHRSSHAALLSGPAPHQSFLQASVPAPWPVIQRRAVRCALSRDAAAEAMMLPGWHGPKVDWSRYHLQVLFVDHSDQLRAKLAAAFFEQVCVGSMRTCRRWCTKLLLTPSTLCSHTCCTPVISRRSQSGMGTPAACCPAQQVSRWSAQEAAGTGPYRLASWHVHTC